MEIIFIKATVMITMIIAAFGLTSDVEATARKDGEYRRRAAREGWGFDSLPR
jgi:hypothetical protein